MAQESAPSPHAGGEPATNLDESGTQSAGTQSAGTQSTGAPSPDNQAPPDGVARQGEDERRGEGGYGNDTGFATGSVAPRDDEDESADAGGRSAREQQTSDTYRDPHRADTA